MGQDRSDKPRWYSFHRTKTKNEEPVPPLQSSSEHQLEQKKRRTAETGGQNAHTAGNDRHDVPKHLDSDTAEKEMSALLWNEAYEKMRNGGKWSLVTTYEEILARLAFDGRLPLSRFSQSPLMMIRAFSFVE